MSMLYQSQLSHVPKSQGIIPNPEEVEGRISLPQVRLDIRETSRGLAAFSSSPIPVSPPCTPHPDDPLHDG